MRSSAIALAITFAACSSPPPGPSGEQPDAGGGGGSDPDAAVPTDGSAAPAPAFRITTPDVPLNPGDEVTFCYYFQTPNTAELSIKRWASHMSPGSHDLVAFLTPTMLQHPGTMSTEACGFSA